jgi:PAS domain S-box-containing protein
MEKQQGRAPSRSAALDPAAVFDDASAFIVALGTDGELLIANRACEALFGHPPAALLGRRLWEIDSVPVKFGETVRQLYAQATPAEQAQWQADWPGSRGMRRIAWSRAARPSADGNGVIQILTGVELSVTPASVASEKPMSSVTNEAPQQLNAELSAVLASMTDGVAIYHADGALAFINPGGERILGHGPWVWEFPLESRARIMSVADEHGRPLNPDDTPIARALLGETVKSMVMRIRRSDDSEVWARTSAAPILEGGRRVGAVAVFIDITERVRLEARLQRTIVRAERHAAEVDAILKAIPFRVYFGTETAITKCNAEALKALGVENVADLNCGLADLMRQVRVRSAVDCSEIDAATLPAARALRGESSVMEFWTIGPGTMACLVRSHATPVLMDGKPIGAVVVDVDITADYRIRETLKETNERLQEENRHRDDFLAVLSHELRNPLGPILSGLAILDRTAPGSEHAHRAKMVIRRQAEQLARLVDDLLDVNRITLNRIALQKQSVDFVKLVAETTEDHRALFEREGTTLELSTPEQPIPLYGDPFRLRQIIGNLLQNAAKFTKRGAHVQVRLEHDPNSRRALLRVTDDGIGINKEILARLFKPFVQAKTSLDRSGAGLGLGLAVVRGIVELHGGRVYARSEGPNRGAEFAIELPTVAALPESVEPSRSETAHRWRILIIEDNVDAAETLRDILELGGHDVQIAFDGREGIETALKSIPQLVLCDIGLPGIDGYEVARTLRADPRLRDCIFVALTGYALPDDVRRSSDAGFHYHISKPAKLEKIEQVFARARN